MSRTRQSRMVRIEIEWAAMVPALSHSLRTCAKGWYPSNIADIYTNLWAERRIGEQDAARTHREEDLNVRASRSEDEQGLPDPGYHEGVGAGRPRGAFARAKAGPRSEEGGGAPAHRRRRDLRHRSRDHLSRAARAHPRRHAAQSELHAGTRIHGHRARAWARRRRIPDRPARYGRNPRRLWPMQALPRGHVHRMPQLRPQLRRCGQ